MQTCQWSEGNNRTWKPVWPGNPLGDSFCSQGLLAGPLEFPSSDGPLQPPPPDSPRSSVKPQLGASQGGLGFITFNFPHLGQRPGSDGATGQRPGLEGRVGGEFSSPLASYASQSTLSLSGFSLPSME